MKKLSPLLLLIIVSILFSACQSPSTTTPKSHSRIGLVTLFDDVHISNASSFMAFPKGKNMKLPALADELANAVNQNLNSKGYLVTPLQINPTLFWDKFREAETMDGGSGWHLGVTKNTLLTIKNLQQQGLINADSLDAIILVGPRKTYSGSTYLSKDGNWVTLYTLDTKPNLISARFEVAIYIIDTRTWTQTDIIWGLRERAVNIEMARPNDIAEMTDAQQAELANRIKPDIAAVAGDLLKNVQGL